jgi:hypothetical protein
MTHTHNVTRRRCCWLSLLIGGPVGLMIVFVGFIILLNRAGEMESAMGILGAYVDAIVGLLVALIPALWWAGRRSYAGLVAGESLLMVSFGYSVFVNSIIWLAFMGMAVIQNFGDFSWALLLPGLILFVVGSLFSTVTIGLAICYLIKRQIDLAGRGSGA